MAAALALAPAPALAQDATGQPPATNTPAADSIGPRELQNFSLDGTVTRPADPQPRRAASLPGRPPRPHRRQLARPRRRRGAAAGSAPPAASTAPPAAARHCRQASRQVRAASTVTVALPSLQNDLPRGGSAQAASASAPAPGHRLQPAPGRWRRTAGLAFLAVAARGRRARRRRRHSCSGAAGRREAFAGGPQFDAFAAPEPQPAPRRAPQPAAGAAKAPAVLPVAGHRFDRALAPVDRARLPAAALHRRGRAGDDRVRARAAEFGQRRRARGPGRSEPVQRRPGPGRRRSAASSPTRSARATGSPPSSR